MKRVLVTGASGFLGQHCVAPLRARGFEIHAITRGGVEVTASLDDIAEVDEWHTADLLETADIASLLGKIQPTHLLHLAWVTEPPAFWESAQNDVWARASLDLFRAFRQQGGIRIVAAGSCAEYDWQQGRCHESRTPTLPSTGYGRAKLRLYESARQQLAASDPSMPTTATSLAWARIFFLYGPGGHASRIPAAVVQAIVSRTRLACSSGQQIRDFLHVADAASALALLVDHQIEGPVNVGSGEPVSIRELIELTAELMQGREFIQFGEMPLRSDDPPLLVADTTRLRDEVGWRPHFDLQQGLMQFTGAYRSERGLSRPHFVSPLRATSHRDGMVAPSS